MKNRAAILLAIAVGALGVFACWQAVILYQERREVRELTARLDSTSNTARLDLQAKCAKQAREFLSQFDNRDAVETRNHYNVKLNKCFVETRTVSFAFAGQSESKVLTDAFEGKDYGTYIFVAKPNKADWQVSPAECRVTLPSGEETTCHSLDEFDALVRQYMQ